MNNGTLAAQGPVGTRGGDGWMWGPCACPRPVHVIRQDIIKPRRNHTATRTSTRPPPLPTSAPCPYRTRTRPPLPFLIVKNHQDGDAPFPPFLYSVVKDCWVSGVDGTPTRGVATGYGRSWCRLP